ncbi:MAG: hypothetical protein DRJ03_01965 [Chloroflexi bacterium]|nr:MAG: hypothetical protein DRJ03_01965 [Chloroflexota bacterium]
MKREKIDFNQPAHDVIATMCEGNPGALRVLSQLALTDPTLIVALDDMNIRGPQVWLGYKDHCREKLEVFTRCIRERDARMITTINEEYARYPSDEFRPKAVEAVGHSEREELE